MLKGGTVYVIPDEVIFVPRSLARFISEHQLTEILFTPSLLQSVLNSADREQLRGQIVVSTHRLAERRGRARQPAQASAGGPSSNARLFNTYSISETHDVCTIDLTDLPLDGMDACPVGYAMDGVELRVRLKTAPQC